MRLLRAIAIMLLLTGCGRQAGIEVEGLWIREAPPGSTVNAGYASIRNAGTAPVTLTGANSSRFGGIEIHEMQMQEGRMRMQRRESLTIAAGETLRLQPGGLHLMLFRASSAPQSGETIPFTLHFGEQRIDAQAEVRSENP